MTIRLFEEPADLIESALQEHVSFGSRLLYCAGASLVAIVPAVAAVYSAMQITKLFRSMTNAENAKPSTVLAQLSIFNTPLAVALGVAALLAFLMAIALATDPKRRLAAVGLPFTIGIPILAASPALFLWFAETATIDVLSGKQTNTPIPVIAETIARLLFLALASGLTVHAATLLCAILSLCIPVRSRSDAFSIKRAFVWVVVGVLLLFFAGAYFVLV